MIHPAPMSSRVLATGAGWHVQEVVCGAGPSDPRFEEQHAWTSVAAVLQGTFTYRTSAGRALLVPGALMLGEAGSSFECGHDHGRGDHCVSFHVSPALSDELLAGRRGRRSGHAQRYSVPSLPPDDRWLPVLASARLLTRRSSEPLLAEQLCLDAATLALDAAYDQREQQASAAEQRRAVTAVAFIEARLAGPLTIVDIAAAAGMSRRRFATAFRRAVGISPYAFVLQRRLEAAAVRLRTDDESVLQVALACGFGDLSEFTRRFGACFGVAPGRFRRGDWHHATQFGMQTRQIRPVR